jgi:transposase
MSEQGKFDYRYKLVKFAIKYGNKPCSREYNISVQTVRKWVKRYKEKKLKGLEDESKRPKNSPNKCSPTFEKKIVQLRLQTKHKYGAKRLIERYDLKCGKGCIQRIVNEHGLKKEKKTKKKTRNLLWGVKKLTKLFDKIQVDVKVLTDIPQYWNVYSRAKLPKYEFTARDVKTGASFVCYAHNNNSANAATFIAYLMEHIKSEGFDVKEITWQMDNGAEFFACGNNKKGKTPVETIIEDVYKSKIGRIPPASPTFNSDVETFHRLVEDEFYDIEDISSVNDLLRKQYIYLIDFNYLRKNSYRDNKTPIELAREDYPGLKLSVFSLQPVILEEFQELYLKHCYPKKDFFSSFEDLFGWGSDSFGYNMFPDLFKNSFLGGNDVSSLDTDNVIIYV